MKTAASKRLLGFLAFVTLVMALTTHSVLAQTRVIAWGRPVITNLPPDLTNIVDIAAGDGFAVALRADGTLRAWGTNVVAVTNVPAGISNIVAVEAAARHVLALRGDGKVFTWGNDSAVNQNFAPTNATRISAGWRQNLAVLKGGTVASWPDRNFIPFGGLSNIVDVAVGGSHGLALTASGMVIAWGDNGVGQGDVPEGLSNVVSVAAGTTFSAALTAEGRLHVWGRNTYASLPQLPGGDKFVSISASLYHLLAIREDGSVFAWGGNFSGQTNVPPSVTNAVLLAAGDNVSLAVSGPVPAHVRTPMMDQMALLHSGFSLKPEVTGSLPITYQWTRNGQVLPGATNGNLEVPGLRIADAGAYALVVSNHAGMSTTRLFSLEITQVKLWGLLGSGAFAVSNIPPSLTNLVAIAGGDSHIVALRRDGTVIQWGNAGAPVPDGLTNVVSVAAGSRFSVALRSDGYVVVWGSANAATIPVPDGLQDVAAIAAGWWHVVALRSDGTVVAWGPPSAGDFSAPSGLDNVVAISATFGASTALRADGSLVHWPKLENTGPADPATITNAVALAGSPASSVGHTLAQLADGSISVWGYPRYLYPVPAGLPFESMAAGGSHDLFLLAGGSVAASGANAGGATNVPAGLPPAASVFATGGAAGILVGSGAPYVTTALLDRRIAAGASLAIEGHATGEFPIHYQWLFAGQPITGATNSLLLVSEADANDSGEYTLVASNALGTAMAGLQVAVVPALVKKHPVSITNWFGSTASFAVDVLGRDVRIQWQRNGVDLSGQTNTTLVIQNAGDLDAGLYRAVLANEAGSVFSMEAALRLQRVAHWGDPIEPQAGQFLLANTNVLGIAAGNGGALVFDPLNTLWPIGRSNVIAASAAHSFTLMLHPDGTVSIYGQDASSPLAPPSGLTNVVAVAAGYYHALALKSDGTLLAWGDDNSGSTNVPPGLTNVVAIAAGHQLSLALQRDGRVVQWGNTNAAFAPPADLTNIVGISSALTASVALREDGTAVTWGTIEDPTYGGPVPASPVGLSNLVRVVSGGLHYLGLTAHGEVVAWGLNSRGETNVPPGLRNVQDMAAGYHHNLALTAAHPPTQRVSVQILSRPGEAAFRVAVPSSVNRVYTLEYTDDLAEPVWHSGPLIAGTGHMIELTDPMAGGKTRFYRVRRW